MSKPPTIAELADWIMRINDEAVNLSEWETQFMESINDQWTRRQWLTARQIEIIERIYTEKVP